MDQLDCAVIDDVPDDDNDIDIEIVKILCHDLEKLRNSQTASAVS